MATLSNEQLDCLEQYAEANGAVGSLKDLFDLIAQARRANDLLSRQPVTLESGEVVQLVRSNLETLDKKD